MSHKLILADDSITIQKVVELILAEEDFEIKSTNNGEEALAAIPSFQPDVVLADIEMPKMNGYQLCEKIKQDPSSQGISVILLAGAFEPIDEELAKQVKADDYIIKPFESQELLSKLNAVLTASPAAVAEEEGEEPVEVAAIEADETQIDEDLWAMEEIPEAAEVTALPEEETTAAGTEEMAELAETLDTEPEIPAVEEEPPPIKEKAAPDAAKTPIPDTGMLSNEEMRRIFENAVNAKMTSLVSSIDIKEAILSSLTPLIKDSVEKVIWEVAPEITEKMLKEMLKGSLESLTKEVEKVIWETVPDLAETMISKEIERIRSEF
jgi:CheY-like chemotaxis protein